jgi:hypothetical protein
VIAREAVLNDPEVVRLLRSHFVAIGVDNVAHPNMTAAEKAFLADKGLKFCTQGMSVFTAGGRVLAMGGGYQPGPVRQMLQKALEKYRPEEPPPAVPPRDEHDRGLFHPPAGGLVFYVTWKVLGGDGPQASPASGSGRYDRMMYETLGVDRLWVRADEAEALARGAFPDGLRKRLTPHVAYTMGGKVKALDVTLRGGRLAGSFRTEDGERGSLLGFVEARGGKVTRFDLVFRGQGRRVEDCGFAAGLTVVPRGRRVPVGLLFRLADPADDLARVPPHRADHNGYLR